MEAANKKRKWNTRRSIAAGVITLVACAVSLGMGRYAIAPYDVLRAICDLFTGSDTVSDTMRHVVCFVRVPRIFGALLCGAGLAAAGAGFQAVFANPLATPDTLGVGNAASFGAVAAILMGAGRTGIQSSALFCGLFSVCLVYLFAGTGGENRTLRLVLSGMIIGSFFSSMVSFAKYVADPQDELPSITYWLLGSLKNMSWTLLLSGAGWILTGIVILLLFRWKLDALMLSEEEKFWNISARFSLYDGGSFISNHSSSRLYVRTDWLDWSFDSTFLPNDLWRKQQRRNSVFDSIWCIVFTYYGHGIALYYSIRNSGSDPYKFDWSATFFNSAC